MQEFFLYCVFGPLFFLLLLLYVWQPIFFFFYPDNQKKGKDGKIGLGALGNAAKVSPHTYACGYVRQFFFLGLTKY